MMDVLQPATARFGEPVTTTYLAGTIMALWAPSGARLPEPWSVTFMAAGRSASLTVTHGEHHHAVNLTGNWWRPVDEENPDRTPFSDAVEACDGWLRQRGIFLGTEAA